MATYYTLHVFDSEKYFKSVLPKMKTDKIYLSKYMETDAFKLFTYRYDRIKKTTIDEFQEFLKNLSIDGQTYSGDFQSLSIPYGFYKLIEIIIFSECAIFSPYFHLGKNAVENKLKFAVKNTLAEEITNKLSNCGDYSIFGYESFGIYNWLTKDDVELLYLDLDKIIPRNEIDDYSRVLKIMITEAYRDKLGLICCKEPIYGYHCHLKNDSANLQRFKAFSNQKYFVEIDCSRMQLPLDLNN
jgi:hypothetical protein